jgi:hypothetical protein
MKIKMTSLLLVAISVASVLGKAKLWNYGFFQG